MKRKIAFLLMIMLILGLFNACGKDQLPDGPAELWVVTELTDKYGMNDQAQRMIERFNEQYPEVTVKLDILPTEPEERAVYLQKIRSEIMAGDGPDAYLLPTRNWVPDPTSLLGLEQKIVPLFRDPKLTMYNGIFYDISEFYDEDETLKKDALNTSVLDGGIIDGGRYILPLRYDVGVYLVDRENFEALGGDVSVFDDGIDDVMRFAIEIQDSAFARYADPNNYEYYFSTFYDYSSGTVSLTAEEVAEFMEIYQALDVVAGTEVPSVTAGISGYVIDNSPFFATEGYAMGRSHLHTLLDVAAGVKMYGESIEFYPMRACDGTLNATVRYYTAVGAGAEYPRLAYEFIKLFLSDEAQYETYMTGKKYRDVTSSACIGWPVRTVGSVAPRLENMQYQWSNYDFRGNPKQIARQKKFVNADLLVTDADIPALTWQVDEVMFPIIMETEDSLAHFTEQLNDFFNNNAALDADIDTMARQYIENLQLYLNEG